MSFTIHKRVGAPNEFGETERVKRVESSVDGVLQARAMVKKDHGSYVVCDREDEPVSYAHFTAGVLGTKLLRRLRRHDPTLDPDNWFPGWQG